MSERIDENELWMLSLYRRSEISGAMFFGKLANVLKPGPIQFDMTRHFADESRHAWQWTECIVRLGAKPLPFDWAYQDRYLKAVGVPANIMEILAITHVFERRVFNHYTAHRQLPLVRPEVKETLMRIMDDEKWHLAWVGRALKDMEVQFGSDAVTKTLRRCSEADKDIYRQLVNEHAERMAAFTQALSNRSQEMLQ